MRVLLSEIIHHELHGLPEKLNELDTKERLEVISKLIPFVLPRMGTVELDTSKPVTIIVPPLI